MKEKEKVSPPNKNIASQIHRACFDYKQMESMHDSQTIEDRVYAAYNGVFQVIKDWIEKDEQGFIGFVKEMKIDQNPQPMSARENKVEAKETIIIKCNSPECVGTTTGLGMKVYKKNFEANGAVCKKCRKPMNPLTN